MKSNYMIITTRKIDGKTSKDTLGEERLPAAKKVANFIIEHFSPDTIIVVNQKGKVGLYEVAGHPEKREERFASEMV